MLSELEIQLKLDKWQLTSLSTDKSLSEALILGSTNPQYDK